MSAAVIAQNETGADHSARFAMKRIVEITFAILIGTFALHCTSSGGGHGATDGGVDTIGTADAAGGTDNCCQPGAPTFTKLAEGDILGTASTAPIAVAGYRQVVMYQSGCGGGVRVQFRPDANTGFGDTDQTMYGGGVIRVDGVDMTLSNSSPGCPAGVAIHYVIAGVK